MNNLENQNEPFESNALFYWKPMKSFKMRRHVFSRKSGYTIYNSTKGILYRAKSMQVVVRDTIQQRITIIYSMQRYYQHNHTADINIYGSLL